MEDTKELITSFIPCDNHPNIPANSIYITGLGCVKFICDQDKMDV